MSRGSNTVFDRGGNLCRDIDLPLRGDSRAVNRWLEQHNVKQDIRIRAGAKWCRTEFDTVAGEWGIQGEAKIFQGCMGLVAISQEAPCKIPQPPALAVASSRESVCQLRVLQHKEISDL
jgi:hypothetical protein